jgi:hypothetical protein
MASQIAELVDVQQDAGQEVLNVYHFLDTTGALSIATLAADYIANVEPTMAAFQHSNLSHTAVKYRQVYPAATLQLSVANSPALVGGSGTTPMPSADAASMGWILGSGTVNLVGGTLPHIKRGGVRIAGITEAQVNANTMIAGYIAAARAWWALLLDGGMVGWELCVVSFLNAARVRQHTAQQYAIVTGTTDPAPSTQNSRKVLRGRNG